MQDFFHQQYHERLQCPSQQLISMFIPNSCTSIFLVFNQDTKKLIGTNNFLLQLQAIFFFHLPTNSPPVVCVFSSPKPRHLAQAHGDGQGRSNLCANIQKAKDVSREIQAPRRSVIPGTPWDWDASHTNSHIFRDSNMGIVWEAYPKKSPLILHPILGFKGRISSGSESAFLWQISDFFYGRFVPFSKQNVYIVVIYKINPMNSNLHIYTCYK